MNLLKNVEVLDPDHKYDTWEERCGPMSLYLDFSSEEITAFLKNRGYKILKVKYPGMTRMATSMAGGEVSLSDPYESLLTTAIAVKESDSPQSAEEIPEFRVQTKMRKLIKEEMLAPSLKEDIEYLKRKIDSVENEVHDIEDEKF